MEIKNDVEASKNGANDPSDKEIQQSECSDIINNISEQLESTCSEPILPKNSGDVVDFDQILTKFLEKYENARKSEEKPDNIGSTPINEDFNQLFPQRSLEKELENPDFQLFCRYKGKNTTYGECYKDFCSLVDSIERKTEKKVLSSLANKESSVGSLSSEEAARCDYFTKEQVLRMSSDQIKKNYNKIRESQQKW